VLFLMWREVEPPASRFVASQAELRSVANRTSVWDATIGMIRDYPVLGTGLGTFGPAFRLYQPSYSAGRFDHAHNDWLQAVAEGGVVLLVAFALAIWLAFRKGRPGGRAAWPDPLRSAAVASVTAVLVHATIDFPLHIPAIAATTAVAIGMALACQTVAQGETRRGDGSPTGRPHQPTRGRPRSPA